MKLHNPNARVFIPDNTPLPRALERTTHMGIGAHQDDLEFMAFHGILACYNNPDQWFTGVTCTNGSGSSRTGPYSSTTDEQMMVIRRKEQDAAAVIGQYGAMLQLDYPSRAVKSARDTDLRSDLLEILKTAAPEVVYTHNLADKHDTHIGVAIASIEAMRELPESKRPRQVIGCEIWRNLDWMIDQEKVCMNVSERANLAAALNGVFDSQIAGGKRYDLAIAGRRASSATFFESHASDNATQLVFGMDLTPLIQDKNLDIIEYTCSFINRFKADVESKLRNRLGR